MVPRFDKLLVLDLDETLVFANDRPLPDREADFQVFGYHVYRRPGLQAFLASAFDAFTVGVWTASSADYAHAVLARTTDVSRLRFVFARERCTMWSDPETRDRFRIKDIRKLRKLGFTKAQILFVDDSPEKLRRSYGNYVRAMPFEGDPTDDELPLLSRYLETLGPVANVRTIEKRGWRRHLEPG